LERSFSPSIWWLNPLARPRVITASLKARVEVRAFGGLGSMVFNYVPLRIPRRHDLLIDPPHQWKPCLIAKSKAPKAPIRLRFSCPSKRCAPLALLLLMCGLRHSGHSPNPCSRPVWPARRSQWSPAQQSACEQALSRCDVGAQPETMVPRCADPWPQQGSAWVEQNQPVLFLDNVQPTAPAGTPACRRRRKRSDQCRALQSF